MGSTPTRTGHSSLAPVLSCPSAVFPSSPGGWYRIHGMLLHLNRPGPARSLRSPVVCALPQNGPCTTSDLALWFPVKRLAPLIRSTRSESPARFDPGSEPLLLYLPASARRAS